MSRHQRNQIKKLKEAGFSQRVRRLAGGVGHNSLKETEDILKKDTLPPEDTAFLVMHYVDDYTVNNEWVKPTVIQDGKKINDFSRRMDKAEANPRYAKHNEEGRQHFDGKTSLEAQREIGRRVEERLAALVSQRTGHHIEPLDLPQYIDERIKADIASIPLK